jgi:uncharacterized protein YegJ (DUF2314 family)
VVKSCYGLLVVGPCFLALTGCQPATSRSGVLTTEGSAETETVSRRTNEPDEVLATDAEMNQAMEEARRTVQTFVVALQSPRPGQNEFTVKKRFQSEQGVEYIWLHHISYNGSVFKGEVSDQPVYDQKVNVGDIVTVPAKEISDWMFADHGKMKGGYTLRVLYNRYSPQEKKEFQEQSKMVVE